MSVTSSGNKSLPQQVMSVTSSGNKSLPQQVMSVTSSGNKSLPQQVMSVTSSGNKSLPVQGPSIDNTKDNTSKEIVNKLTTKPNGFGNQDINLILSTLKEKMELPKLDLSERVNRRYATILLRSSKKGVEGVLWLVDVASHDPWFKNHITSLRDLWSNQVKIIASIRAKRRECVEI
jgi:hypothetical protein